MKKAIGIGILVLTVMIQTVIQCSTEVNIFGNLGTAIILMLCTFPFYFIGAVLIYKKENDIEEKKLQWIASQDDIQREKRAVTISQELDELLKDVKGSDEDRKKEMRVQINYAVAYMMAYPGITSEEMKKNQEKLDAYYKEYNL